MADINKRYFFAVGQKSFLSTDNQTLLSTVVPIADEKGEIVDERQSEFPNRGLGWRMLRGNASVTHPPPGCLIVSAIQYSMFRYSSESDKDIYQLRQLILPSQKDLIEILTPDVEIADPNALLDGFRMCCDHEPTGHVLVRFGDRLYGPLRVEIDPPENDRSIKREIHFKKPYEQHDVYRIATVDAEDRPGHIRHEVVVSCNDRPPEHPEAEAVTVHYEAITGALFEDLRNGANEVELVSLQDAARQVTNDLLFGKEQREFLDRFKELVEEAQSNPTPIPIAITRVQSFLDGQSADLAELDQFRAALLSDERYKQKIEQAFAAELEKRVVAEASRIEKLAQESVAKLTAELAQLEEELRTKRDACDREIAAKRKAAEEEIENRKKELVSQEQILKKASRKLSEKRTGLLSDFLALEPLLAGLCLGAGTAQEAAAPALRLPEYEMPAEGRKPLTQDAFFERFVSHVRECGFKYDRDDLLAFHLSAKERAPVILGGVSGSGKSSLPVLYAEALAGEEADKKRYLAVDVNPSWTGPQDLLGYTDALEHRFIPAASGLVGQMIRASHAHDNLKGFAPVFSVCLEELNLAQPEHYLADVIQAISRAPGNQFIRVFDPDAVRGDDLFRPYARLELSPNLIFVGTVTSDETTRPLSIRFLDRCNFIEFVVGEDLPVLPMTAQTGASVVQGSAVLQSDRDRWAQNTDELARARNVLGRTRKILGEIQPELIVLGCGLTPRRQTSICRFIANAQSLCNFDKALDMQLRQRILPQIRRLYRPGALEALGRLSGKLEKAHTVPRTLKSLGRLESDARASDNMFLGEE